MTASEQPSPQDASRGFFSRCFKREELRDLAAHPLTGLEEGIDLLRVAIRRFLDLSDPDIEGEWVKWLNAISLAGARLGKLTQLRETLDEGQDEASQAIAEALEEVMAEMNIRKNRHGTT